MNKFKSRKAMAAVVAGVAVVGGGGAAIASAQPDSTSPQAFFDSVAKHLGISSEELEDATKAAAIDQVDAALAEGKITEEQAERMRERIESGDPRPSSGRGSSVSGAFTSTPPTASYRRPRTTSV